MLCFENVYKKHGDRVILNDISFVAEKHQVIGIIGIAGSGKTSLLRCAMGLDTVNAGSISINGSVTLVFQGSHLFPNMTVIRNIIYAAIKNKSKLGSNVYKQAMAMLNFFGIADKANSYPSELSGGQQQIVAILRAIAINTDIILMDEPTSALDVHTTEKLINMMNIIKTNRTIVVSSHDLPFIKAITTRIIAMKNGAITKDIKSSDFFSHFTEYDLGNML